jgi:hypothetical protein
MQSQQKRVNPLARFCKQNELGKLQEDQCYIDRRDDDNSKQYEFQVYHYHPYGSRVQATCYPGQHYWDGHVGGANVDEESKVSRYPGYEMTKDKDHHQLEALPVQLPRVRGWFDADTESNLRYEAVFNKKPCGTVTEKSFIPVTFQNFDSLCYNPQEPQYIIPEMTYNKCFAAGKYYHWGGEDTRHDRQERYRNGCDWRPKNFPQNLSYSNFGY